MASESEAERALRELRGETLEQAAERYDATRSGYPEELVSCLLLSTAEKYDEPVGTEFLQLSGGIARYYRA